MSEKLINFMQEKANIGAISFNRSQTLLQVFTDILQVGRQAKLTSKLLEACILVPAFSEKRVNLHVKFKLNELSSYASPEAVKLAMIYASVNNPVKDLWDGTTGMTGTLLEELQTIDVLYGLASDLPTNEHHAFAAKAGIAFKASARALKQLEADYHAALSAGFILDKETGVVLKTGDGHIFTYLAYLSHLPTEQPYEVIALDVELKMKSFWFTPSQLKALLNRLFARFGELHADYTAAKKAVEAGTLTRKLIDISK